VELTKVPKSKGRRRKKRGGRKKNGDTKRKYWDPRAAGRRPLVADWPRAYPTATALFLNFFDFFEFFFWNAEVLLGIWGEWVHSTPIFSSFPLHLEVSNLPFLITFGDFTFFGIIFFLNLE
jgi:hypothetical protein